MIAWPAAEPDFRAGLLGAARPPWTPHVDTPELQRRAAAITARQRELEHKHTSLAAERADLARGNRLRHGPEGFAARVAALIDQLDPTQRQDPLRLLIEDVQVTGWHIQIGLHIPLNDPPDKRPSRPPRIATQPGIPRWHHDARVNRGRFAFPSCSPKAPASASPRPPQGKE